MSNLKLNPEPPIGFNKKSLGDLTLIEEDDFSIVSVSLSIDRLPAFKKFVLNNFKTNIPEVGKSKFTKNKNMRIIGLQPGQFFILFERNSHHPVNEIKNIFGNDLFYSDQSDSWSVITISGSTILNALERICQLDLSLENFQVNDAQRTSMEHIGVILIRVDKNEFLLFSPRSSCSSFFHALTTSAKNIL